MSDHLEVPEDYFSLYQARGQECREMDSRPAFTGDVFKDVNGDSWAIVQHPCTFSNASDQLLVAKVEEGALPNSHQWRDSSKRMYLPEVEEANLIIRFDALMVKSTKAIDLSARTVILSNFGVNLLLQRWIHNNARVVVKTATIHESTSDVFEETDMMFDAEQTFVEAGLDAGTGWDLVAKWLSSEKKKRRKELKDPQMRPKLRVELDALIEQHLHVK